MINKQADELFNQLLEKIELIEENLSITVIQKAQACLELISEKIAQIKMKVIEIGFKDQQEEIDFFKRIKPGLVGLQIFYSRLEILESNKPETTIKDMRKYLRKQISKIREFYKYQKSVVHYYRSGSAQLDSQLFLRESHSAPLWLVPLRLDQDERFSTIGDHTFARIIAYDKLNNHIKRLLTEPGKDENTRQVKHLKWTGEGINLIEIAYGIYYTKQLNDGKAGIAEIVRYLEDIFQVSIGRAYRRFTEIKRRKRISQTKYLDEMKEVILKKIDEDDEYRPGAFGSRGN